MAQHITRILLVVLAVNTFAFSQTIKTAASLNGVTLKAFSYFDQVEGRRFDDYLSRIRPVALAPELRNKVFKMLPKDDLANPSADELAKLRMVEPILKYHQRDSVIELKVLRATTATAVFLAGAAVLITEPALKILTTGELQAVVAHELGHEYYWTRFELARKNHDYTELQELELRCDGIAVVTLNHLGLDPQSLVSAITKLNKYNSQQSSSSAQNQNYVAFNERVAFVHRVIELVSDYSDVKRATSLAKL